MHVLASHVKNMGRFALDFFLDLQDNIHHVKRHHANQHDMNVAKGLF